MFDNKVSSEDLKNIDKTLLDLKEKVLSDFVIHFLKGKIKYSVLKNELLSVPKKKPKKLIIIKPDKKIDVDNRCMARIYDRGYYQCKKSRQDYSDYCFIHIKKRNYGRIDETK